MNSDKLFLNAPKLFGSCEGLHYDHSIFQNQLHLTRVFRACNGYDVSQHNFVFLTGGLLLLMNENR